VGLSAAEASAVLLANEWDLEVFRFALKLFRARLEALGEAQGKAQGKAHASFSPGGAGASQQGSGEGKEEANEVMAVAGGVGISWGPGMGNKEDDGDTQWCRRGRARAVEAEENLTLHRLGRAAKLATADAKAAARASRRPLTRPWSGGGGEGGARGGAPEGTAFSARRRAKARPPLPAE